MDKTNKTFTSIPGAYSKINQGSQRAYKSKDINTSVLDDLDTSKNLNLSEVGTFSNFENNKFYRNNNLMEKTFSKLHERPSNSPINMNNSFNYTPNYMNNNYNKNKYNNTLSSLYCTDKSFKKNVNNNPVSLKANLNNSRMNCSFLETNNNFKSNEKYYLNQTHNLPVHITSISITSKNSKAQVYSSDFNYYIIGQKKNKRNFSSVNLKSKANKTYYNDYSGESSAYKDRKNQSSDCYNTDNTSKNSNNNENEDNQNYREKSRIYYNQNGYHKSSEQYKNLNNSAYNLGKDFSEGILMDKTSEVYDRNSKADNDTNNNFKGNCSHSKTLNNDGGNYICPVNKNTEINKIPDNQTKNNSAENIFKIGNKNDLINYPDSINKEKNAHSKICSNYIIESQNTINEAFNNNSNTSNNCTFMANEVSSNREKVLNVEEMNQQIKGNLEEKLSSLRKDKEKIDDIDKLEFEQFINSNNEKFKEINTILEFNSNFSKKINNYLNNSKIDNLFDESFKSFKFYDEKFPPSYKSFFSIKLDVDSISNTSKTTAIIQINNIKDLAYNGMIDDTEESSKINKKMQLINSGVFNSIIFKRPFEIFGKMNYSLFSKKINEKFEEPDYTENDNILNGAFNNVMTIIQRKFPFLIYRIFKTNKINIQGYYEITLYINNKWQIVYVDDLLPFDNKEKKFYGLSRNNSDIWKILLEKAIAKAYGGYLNYMLLDANILFNLITGFNSVEFDNKSFDLFNYIIDCMKNNFCLCAKLNNSENSFKDNSLYFTIEDAFEINIEEKANTYQHKIIKLIKPSIDLSLKYVITNFDFISNRDENIYKEIAFQDTFDKNQLCYLNYSDFKENFSNLYCCMSFVDDENLKKSKTKKNCFVIKNNNIQKKESKDRISNYNPNKIIAETQSTSFSIDIEQKETYELNKNKNESFKSIINQTVEKKEASEILEKEIKIKSEKQIEQKDKSSTFEINKIQKPEVNEKKKNILQNQEKNEAKKETKVTKPKRKGSHDFGLANIDSDEEVDKHKNVSNDKEAFKAKFQNFIDKAKEKDKQKEKQAVPENQSNSNNTVDLKVTKLETENKNVPTIINKNNVENEISSQTELSTCVKKEEKRSALRKLKEFEMETPEFKKVEKMKKLNETNEIIDKNKNLTSEQLYENLRKENNKDEFKKDIFNINPTSSKKDEATNKKDKQKETENKTNDLVASLKEILSRNKKLKEEEEQKNKANQEPNIAIQNKIGKIDHHENSNAKDANITFLNSSSNHLGNNGQKKEKDNQDNNFCQNQTSDETYKKLDQRVDIKEIQIEMKEHHQINLEDKIREHKNRHETININLNENDSRVNKEESISLSSSSSDDNNLLNNPAVHKDMNNNEQSPACKNKEIGNEQHHNNVKDEEKEIVELDTFNTDSLGLRTNEIKPDKYFNNIVPTIYADEKFIDKTFPPEINSFLNIEKYSLSNKERKTPPSKFMNASNILNSKAESTFDNSKFKAKLLQDIKPEDVIFKRASEVFENYSVINKEIQNLELTKSIYEQCLYSVFSSLSMQPENIYDLFCTLDKNDYGFYEVILFIDGIWQKFYVDDYFPFSISENKFIGYSNIEDQIWPMILEKAFAKACGSYYDMYVTDCAKYLSAFTGNESGSLKITKPEIYDFIFDNIKKKSILIANTKESLSRSSGKNVNAISDDKIGLKSSYFYKILDAIEVTSSANKTVKLIKIGSAWEKVKFEGEWSKESGNWTEPLKNKYFNSSIKTIYGYSYLTTEEFIKNFDTVFYCLMTNNNFISHIEDLIKPENKIQNEANNQDKNLVANLKMNMIKYNRSTTIKNNLENLINLENEKEFETEENAKEKVLREDKDSFSMKANEYLNNLDASLNLIYNFNKRFVDPTFLPDKYSLFSLNRETNEPFYENSKEEYEANLKLKKFDNLTWKRISEIEDIIKSENQATVLEDITASTKLVDVFDHTKNENYFSTIIACLIKKPALVDKLIRIKKINRYCYYEVVLFIENSWKIIFVDDYIPYDKIENKPYGIQSYKNQVWPIILHKAWAKICGGYLNMNIMNPATCFIALTGYESGFYETPKIDVFQFTYDSLKNGYFLIAKSKKDFQNSLGAQPNYYYIVVNCFETNKNGHLFKLLKIRSPWSNFDWSGQWSLSSNIWEEEVKQIMWKKSVFTKNGFFIVNYEEFINNFDYLYYCFFNIQTKDENKIPSFQKEYIIEPLSNRSNRSYRDNENSNLKNRLSNKDLKKLNSLTNNNYDLKMMKMQISSSSYYSTTKYITPINGFNKYDNSSESLNLENSDEYYFWNIDSRSTSNIMDIFISKSNQRRKQNKKIVNLSQNALGKVPEKTQELFLDDLCEIIYKYRKEKLKIKSDALPSQDELNLIRFLKYYKNYASFVFQLEPGSPLDSQWYFKELRNNGVWLSQYEYGNLHMAIHAVDKHIRIAIYKGNLQWGKSYCFDFFYDDVNSNFFYSFEGVNIDGQKQGDGKHYKKVGFNFNNCETIEVNYANNIVQSSKFIMPDGLVWVGPVKNDIFKSGTGTIKTPDGKSWQCTYNMDIFIK